MADRAGSLVAPDRERDSQVRNEIRSRIQKDPLDAIEARAKLSWDKFQRQTQSSEARDGFMDRMSRQRQMESEKIALTREDLIKRLNPITQPTALATAGQDKLKEKDSKSLAEIAQNTRNSVIVVTEHSF